MAEGCPMRGLMRALSSRRPSSTPHRAYARLREAGPLHNVPYFGAALTGLDDVRATLFDRELSVSSAAARPGTARAQIAAHLPDDLRALPAPLFLQDDPDHRRLRKLLAPAFCQRAIDALRPRIGEIAADLVEPLQDLESFDLIARFAAPLPLYLIGDILGVAPVRRHALRAHSEGIVNELHPLASPTERSAAIAAHRGLATFFRQEITAHRHNRGAGLIASLVDACDQRGELSEDEIVSLCVNLLVAGHVTTTDLIGVLVWLLLSNPAELARLRAQPELWAGAVDEALRCEPPTPLLARVCTRPKRLHGQDLQPGDNLNVFIASANRDPRAFNQPDRFDVTRTHNAHLSFGGGAHFCLGAQLARAEAEIAARTLLDRLPTLTLAEGVWRQNVNFRGLQSLVLRHSPAATAAAAARTHALA